MSQLPFNLPSQGARAGHSGLSLEMMVEATFSARKVRPVNNNPEFHYESDIFGRKDRILIRQVLLNGWRVDFLYKNFKTGLKVPIECRQQLGSGTTDEKLPHMIDKLVACNCPGFWLVLGGGGFSPKMVDAVQKKISEMNERHKIRGRLVFNEGPFLQRAVEQLIERDEI
jgi:hypothetical protein